MLAGRLRVKAQAPNPQGTGTRPWGSHPRSRQPRVNKARNHPTHGNHSWQEASYARSGDPSGQGGNR